LVSIFMIHMSSVYSEMVKRDTASNLLANIRIKRIEKANKRIKNLLWPLENGFCVEGFLRQ